MNRLVARELMDDPIDSIVELQENLADIGWANRHLGGLAPIVRNVRRTGAQTVLDVCCGDGDIARALTADARRRGATISIAGLDCSVQMLTIAAGRTPPNVAVTYVEGDALALPFADGAFDVTVCNLALHHFEPAAARIMLGELRRVARLSPVVCDLRRSPAAYAAALFWSRTSANRLTRHDAPLSVRRAYTARETRALAASAGWRVPHVRAEAFFRMTATDGRLDGALVTGH